jgi:hypothetical protein
MGSFYTNITLRTTNQNRIVEVLSAAGRTAFVSQPQSGYIVVYDSDTEDQDIDALKELGDSLSAKLGCAALAVLIHDDDLLFYSLHENGRLVDEYASASLEERDEAPEGGDAARLCRAFGAADAAQVETILRTDRAGGSGGGYVFETERHEDLVKALGLPVFAVATGFHYLEQGELPEGATPGSFVSVG